MPKTRVVKIGKSASARHLIFPDRVVVKYKDRIRFTAVDTDAIVLIPHGKKAFGKGPARRGKQYITRYIRRGGSYLTPPRKKLGIRGRTRYPYAVYCVKLSRFAGMSPVMLMDPP